MGKKDKLLEKARCNPQGLSFLEIVPVTTPSPSKGASSNREVRTCSPLLVRVPMLGFPERGRTAAPLI